MARVTTLRAEMLGIDEDMSVEKRFFNTFMLQREDLFRTEIETSPDPLRAALQLSRTGNYIDFSAVDNVTDETLLTLLAESKNSVIDKETLQKFREELSSAKQLVFCTDNCGEIVLDKVLIKTLKKLYPALQVTVIVRGGAVINDATIEDAGQVGLCDLVPVIGSGAPIPGTDLEAVSDEARAVLNAADLIITKGKVILKL